MGSEAPDVFISYAREDRFLASMLEEQLEAVSLSVFRDENDIVPGAIWREDIERALEECLLATVLWSRTSVKKDFVKEEASRAKAESKLFQTIVDAGVPTLPLGFGEVQAANDPRYRSWVDRARSGAGARVVLEGLDEWVAAVKQAVRRRQDRRGGASRLEHGVSGLFNRERAFRQAFNATIRAAPGLIAPQAERDQAAAPVEPICLLLHAHSEDSPRTFASRLSFHLNQEHDLKRARRSTGPRSDWLDIARVTLDPYCYGNFDPGALDRALAIRAANVDGVDGRADRQQRIIELLRPGPPVLMLFAEIFQGSDHPALTPAELCELMKQSKRYLGALQNDLAPSRVLIVALFATIDDSTWAIGRYWGALRCRRQLPAGEIDLRHVGGLGPFRVTGADVDKWSGDVETNFNEHYDPGRLANALANWARPSRRTRFKAVEDELSRILFDARSNQG